MFFCLEIKFKPTLIIQKRNYSIVFVFCTFSLHDLLVMKLKNLNGIIAGPNPMNDYVKCSCRMKTSVKVSIMDFFRQVNTRKKY
jgi:hypothetical protein